MTHFLYAQGRGAYGSVVKAKHKMDGGTYAGTVMLTQLMAISHPGLFSCSQEDQAPRW